MTDRLTVTVTEDGPIKVSDAKRLRYCGEPMDVDGDVWLCRCGQSKNKPFCDGSHKNADFEVPGTEA